MKVEKKGAANSASDAKGFFKRNALEICALATPLLGAVPMIVGGAYFLLKSAGNIIFKSDDKRATMAETYNFLGRNMLGVGVGVGLLLATGGLHEIHSLRYENVAQETARHSAYDNALAEITHCAKTESKASYKRSSLFLRYADVTENIEMIVTNKKPSIDAFDGKVDPVMSDLNITFIDAAGRELGFKAEGRTKPAPSCAPSGKTPSP